MRKRPGMSLLVLCALVLGIGVNSAVFSVINAVLLRPMQITDPERVAYIRARSRDSNMPVSYPEYQDWKAQSHAFQDMALYQPVLLNLFLNGHPEALTGWKVTSTAFSTFGVLPAMGRTFVASDELPGAAPVAVISHKLWQQEFGADTEIVGKTITLEARPYLVVGVFPVTDFPLIGDVWVNLGPFLDQHLMNREMRHFYAAGRLAPSVDLPQAQKEMDVIAARLASQYPKSNKDMRVVVQSMTASFTSLVRQPLTLIVIASGLILLLACVNVVTVFIASAIERRKELSVRLALGATKSAIFRQLLVQSLIVAVAGASLGLLVAKAGLAYLIQSFPLTVVRFKETTIDHTVLWFTVCLAIGSTLFSSILPGLYSARLNVNAELKGEEIWTRLSRYRSIGQAALIVFEVALAAGLSLVSGLLIKSFYETQKVDLGYDPHHILSFEVWPPEAKYKDDATKTVFYERVLENLRRVPGVQSAGASFTLPGATGTHTINLQVDAQSPHATERPFVDSNPITPDFLRTMKISILEGRDFTDADRMGAPPVAIVDNVLAARMWPGEDPIGKRLRLADITDDGPPWREIVGVVGQIRYYGPENKVYRLQVYEPVAQHPPPYINFIVNTSAASVTLRRPFEKAVHDLAPDLPLQYFETLDDFLDEKESGRRISLQLLSSFAVLGIVLGMIGIYGVVSNSVFRRRREIAIRMALGATVKNAIVLITRLGLLATLAGIILGSAIVVCLTRVIGAFLFGVKALDPGVYILSAVGIAALAMIASLVPAVTLLRLTPQNILRE